MIAIDNLGEATSDDVRRLLEKQGISIKKQASDHFVVTCPSCNKHEAFIYHTQGSGRTIVCNRKNKCGKKIELWHYIANKQNINPDSSHGRIELLKYINEILGREFHDRQTKGYNAEREERNNEQKFLTDCKQIFFNALNNDKGNLQVSSTLSYLNNRGYNKEIIKKFEIGFFPDHNDLLKLLTGSIYNYPNNEALELMNKYFKGVLGINGHIEEENKNRITFTWYDNKGNIVGFGIRKICNVPDIRARYCYTNGLRTSSTLFNINNLKKEKILIVVEGLLDALTATHLTNEEVQNKYCFVAIGGTTLGEKQAELIKKLGYSKVILFLDSDNAGQKFQSSAVNLRNSEIIPFIINIPEEYKLVKDIDQLITKHPEADLQAILGSRKSAVVVEVERIIKDHNEAKDDFDKVEAIEECVKLKDSLLSLEYGPYCKVMRERLDYHVEINSYAKITKLEQDMSIVNNSNFKSEVEKLKLEVENDITKIEEGNLQSLDIHKIKKTTCNIHKRFLKGNIAAKKDHPQLKELNNILDNAKKYNLLLTTTDYELLYTYPAFLDDIGKSIDGLKTGFKVLDQYVTIQPASLVFIAGRPSHGKTTMMLNLYKNMIEANPDKAFLFYSYEENREDILLKIILSKTVPDTELQQEEGCTLFEKAKNQLKKYRVAVRIQKDGTIKSLSSSLDKACKEAEGWINDERLQILTKKPSVEILSSAIIEHVQTSEQDSKKPIAAIFIDYVQKLSTEEERVNRQQEIQRICQTLLNTSLDKRVNAAIILGAQVNREVKSLETFNLDNMREAGDIEQDANLVLGVWDEQAAELDALRQKLATINEKIEDHNNGFKKDGNINQLNKACGAITNKIDSLHKQKNNTKKDLKIKILKNRNGIKDKIIDLSIYPAQFLITKKEEQ